MNKAQRDIRRKKRVLEYAAHREAKGSKDATTGRRSRERPPQS